MKSVTLLSLLALCGACVAAPPVGPIASRAPLGDVAPISAWIAQYPSAPVVQRIEAYDALCDAYSRISHYSEAADACAREAELRVGEPGDLVNSIAFRRTLAATPPISVTGEVDASLVYGWVGMAEVPVTVNGVTLIWGVDTGAQVSIVSETDARRLGVRLFDEPLHLHGSTPGVASGKLGLIERMQVGSAEIRNVPVFVLPDASLTPMPGHVVPPIFGAPILYAFGRVEFSDHGRHLHLGPGNSTLLPGRMRWISSGAALDVALARGPVRAFFDSGANITELRLSTRALLTAHERATLVSRSSAVAGVSGVVQNQNWEAPAIAVSAGGALCSVPHLRFGGDSGAGDDTAGGSQGRLGIDLAKACRDFTLDFSTMTYGASGD